MKLEQKAIKTILNVPFPAASTRIEDSKDTRHLSSLLLSLYLQLSMKLRS